MGGRKNNNNNNKRKNELPTLGRIPCLSAQQPRAPAAHAVVLNMRAGTWVSDAWVPDDSSIFLLCFLVTNPESGWPHQIFPQFALISGCRCFLAKVI